MKPNVSLSTITGRLTTLTGIVALGLLATTLLGAAFLFVAGEEHGASPAMLRLVQAVQSVGIFFVPAWLMARLIGERPASYLRLDVIPSARQAALTVVSMLLLVVPINAVVEWNERMRLPEALGGVERWMAEHEATSQGLMEQMLGTTAPLAVAANWLVVGLCAALTEEVFFRGLLQRFFYERWRSGALAVLLSAFLFSAIHLQFYGFVPRLLLGAYFGWLLVNTRSLWIPVLAHMTNNTLALAQVCMEHDDRASRLLDRADSLLHTPGLDYVVYAVSLAAFAAVAVQIKGRVRGQSEVESA
jgi:hypothetical protein